MSPIPDTMITMDADVPYGNPHVLPRPCSGNPHTAHEPLHPRPARVDLQVNPLYAADYGVPASDSGLDAMDLTPMLDAIAAGYAGCDRCRQHHIAMIAAQAPLTAHVVGVAVCTLDSRPGGCSSDVLVRKLDPPGAAIAATMRTRGLLAAADVARRMSEDHRLSAVGIAINQMLPTQWYDQYLSNFYPPDESDGRRMPADDSELLDSLMESGYL
ncbi:hypothetical protein [Micromonospora sp. DT47]|uniref:hypothetical protein n=1 Tax=Micromonospora sp. DT47 TaxID=3393431 RepID=UPI003CEF423E